MTQEDTDTRMHDEKRSPALHTLMQQRYGRRQVLRALGHAGALAAVSTALPSVISAAQASASRMDAQASGAWKFKEISKASIKDVASAGLSLPEGYRAQVLLRWGDALFGGVSSLSQQLGATEAGDTSAAHGSGLGAAGKSGDVPPSFGQFGYNNDFIAFMPPRGSMHSNEGLLCVNHEYANPELMFPKLSRPLTQAQVRDERAAHGHSVCHIEYTKRRWHVHKGGNYTRRITAFTDVALSGPAAGHPLMRTKSDPAAARVTGTLANCGGGVTPWGTVLICEENFDDYFAHLPKDTVLGRRHARYGLRERGYVDWHLYYPQYDMRATPHEPHRFGWVVEYDPYDRKCMPVKRTALGRFKHETATVILAEDGRVVVYSGDDEEFEYLYRYVSNAPYVPDDPARNRTLLDNGVLSVARFEADGTCRWIPLRYGKEGLTPENGFHSQAEVCIYTREAADIVGATPMDRPEGITVHPHTGEVYVSMTKNPERTAEQRNVANRRAQNRYGHILRLSPPNYNAHAADIMTWERVLEGGDPREPSHAATYPAMPSSSGWGACPDNLAFDPWGRLWIATDGQPDAIGMCDSLYMLPVAGSTGSGVDSLAPQLFLNAPVGAEVTGPCFTPDGQTLFVSIQHPGEGSSFDAPSTRWPDFNDALPPRPSVIAVTKDT